MTLRKIRKISQNELKEILCLHHRFLMKDPSGSRADLQRADLRGANLRGAKFDQMIPRSCWISSSRWLRSDIPWWVGHPQQNDIVLCDE